MNNVNNFVKESGIKMLDICGSELKDGDLVVVPHTNRGGATVLSLAVVKGKIAYSLKYGVSLDILDELDETHIQLRNTRQKFLVAYPTIQQEQLHKAIWDIIK